MAPAQFLVGRLLGLALGGRIRIPSLGFLATTATSSSTTDHPRHPPPFLHLPGPRLRTYGPTVEASRSRIRIVLEETDIRWRERREPLTRCVGDVSKR